MAMISARMTVIKQDVMTMPVCVPDHVESVGDVFTTIVGVGDVPKSKNIFII